MNNDSKCVCCYLYPFDPSSDHRNHGYFLPPKQRKDKDDKHEKKKTSNQSSQNNNMNNTDFDENDDDNNDIIDPTEIWNTILCQCKNSSNNNDSRKNDDHDEQTTRSIRTTITQQQPPPPILFPKLSSTHGILVDTHGHGHFEKNSQPCYERRSPTATATTSSSSSSRSSNSRSTNTIDNHDTIVVDGGDVDDIHTDTNNHSHVTTENVSSTGKQQEEENQMDSIITLTCAVSQADWVSCLQYGGLTAGGSSSSSSSNLSHRFIAIGIHPWYVADITYEDDTWIKQLEQLIIQYPMCFIGEIGLCKVAQFVRNYLKGKQAALQLQRYVFKKQMQLASKYQRPVTIHCVDQHKVLRDVLQELVNEYNESQNRQNKHGHENQRNNHEDEIKNHNNNNNTNNMNDERGSFFGLPPALALHSFSGTAQQVEQLLKFEKELYDVKERQQRKKQKRRQQQQQEISQSQVLQHNQHPSIDTWVESSSNTTTIQPDEKNSDLDYEQVPDEQQSEFRRPPIFYFGFSHSINYGMCHSEKSLERNKITIQSVPLNRLLCESDVSCTSNILLGTAGSIGYITAALSSWNKMNKNNENDTTVVTLMDVVQITRRNGLQFLTTHLKQQVTSSVAATAATTTKL